MYCAYFDRECCVHKLMHKLILDQWPVIRGFAHAWAKLLATGHWSSKNIGSEQHSWSHVVKFYITALTVVIAAVVLITLSKMLMFHAKPSLPGRIHATRAIKLRFYLLSVKPYLQGDWRRYCNFRYKVMSNCSQDMYSEWIIILSHSKSLMLNC